jgi:hypothetical protein
VKTLFGNRNKSMVQFRITESDKLRRADSRKHGGSEGKVGGYYCRGARTARTCIRRLILSPWHQCAIQCAMCATQCSSECCSVKIAKSAANSSPGAY